MNWTQITINTSPEGIEAVCTQLYELAITGIQIEDLSDISEYGKYWDYIDRNLLSGQNKTCVKVYVTEHKTIKDIEKSMQRLKAEDTENIYGCLECETAVVNDEDWAENWKKYFKPFKVGDRVYIKPEWETIEQSDVCGRIVLNINPGMSFGTGTHETTRMCIELLEHLIHQNTDILDIGCGSGILSIAGMLLGANRALAIDIDSNAVKTAGQNASLNGIPSNRYSTQAGDVVDGLKIDGKYDLVVANIIADVIISIAPYVLECLKTDGIFICSGIINTREQDVIDCLTKHKFKIAQIKRENDWLAISASKN